MKLLPSSEFRECEQKLDGGPLAYAMYTNYGETSESLEGHHGGRDRVRRCRFLMSFQEGLEGYHGRDRVQWYRLFNVISSGSFKDFFKILQVRWQTIL